ncbi:MAG: thioredoxin family protein [Muribaculaceae bacterium]|nr:thioredoxin family protein [Muribaculaceae bacterium]
MTYDEMTRSAENVLVEFYATWCPHCRAMAPVVEQIGEMLEGQVKIVQLDVDTNGEAADAEEVTGTPTFILYKNGKQVWRQSGEMPGEVLLNKITSHIK